MSALKDSVYVMKVTFRHGNGNENKSGNNNSEQRCCEDLDQRLQRAVRHLADPSSSSKKQPTMNTLREATTSSAMSLDIQSRRDQRFLFDTILADGGCRHGGSVQLYPLRIENPAVDQYGNNGGRDVDFESAIVLYNFALVHLQMARIYDRRSQGNYKTNALRSAALQLLELSHNILLPRYMQYTGECSGDDDDSLVDEQMEQVLVSGLVVNSLILQTLRELGQVKSRKGVGFYDSFVFLRELAQDILDSDAVQEWHDACNAAAAA